MSKGPGIGIVYILGFVLGLTSYILYQTDSVCGTHSGSGS